MPEITNLNFIKTATEVMKTSTRNNLYLKKKFPVLGPIL